MVGATPHNLTVALRVLIPDSGFEVKHGTVTNMEHTHNDKRVHAQNEDAYHTNAFKQMQPN